MKASVLFFAGLLLATPVMAGVEKEYDPGKPRVTTPWLGRVDDAARSADLNFVTGMRPHHAGALTMSNEYLNSKEASNGTLKSLARGIIHNQQFEIGVLDSIEHYMSRAKNDSWQQMAANGQAQRQRFLRAPMPAVWGSIDNVSVRDVQFAKAMIVHHQGALDMANDYLRDPNANNMYLKKFCLDILTDQKQEIALMQRIVDAYQGDASAIKITPDMVHGMEGMSHGSHGGHGAHKPVSKKQEKPAGNHHHH